MCGCNLSVLFRYILGQEDGYVVFTLVLQMRLQNDSWKFSYVHMLFSQDVVADTKGSFCQCQGTCSNYGPLLHIVESMVLHKIGVVRPTIDEQYNRVSHHFLLLLMSQIC